jgi:hypothetical protein
VKDLLSAIIATWGSLENMINSDTRNCTGMCTIITLLLPLLLFSISKSDLKLMLFLLSTERSYKCPAPGCPMGFTRLDALKRHLKSVNNSKVVTCYDTLMAVLQQQQQQGRQQQQGQEQQQGQNSQSKTAFILFSWFVITNGNCIGSPFEESLTLKSEQWNLLGVTLEQLLGGEASVFEGGEDVEENMGGDGES